MIEKDFQYWVNALSSGRVVVEKALQCTYYDLYLDGCRVGQVDEKFQFSFLHHL